MKNKHVAVHIHNGLSGLFAIIKASHPYQLILCWLLSVVDGLCIPVSLLFSKYFLDQLVAVFTKTEPLTFQIIWPLVMLFVISTVNTIVTSLTTYLQGDATEILSIAVIDLILSKVDRVPTSTFDNSDIYNSINISINQAPQHCINILTSINTVARNVVSLIGVIGLICSLSPILLISSVIVMIPMFLWEKRVQYQWFAVNSSQIEKRRYSDALLHAVIKNDTINELKLFEMISQLHKKIVDCLSSIFNQNHRMRKYNAAMSFLQSEFSQIVSAFLKVAIIGLALLKNCSLGDANMYLSAIDSLRTALSALLARFSSISADLLYFQALSDIMRLPEENQSNLMRLTSPIETIDFVHVCFSYPGTKREVLHDISFSLKKGQSYAIVGLNGSGKSTITKLLMKLYPVSSGNIYINGIDISRISGASLRAEISAVFQNYVHLPFSLKENVSMGDQDIDIKKIEKAIEFSEASSFIDKLPFGVNTTLQRDWANGTELSIGQWQKVAIARCYYKSGSLLILDEMFASIDAISIKNIDQRIRKNSQNRIVLQITHNYNHLHPTDQLIVLMGGKVVATGTNSVLLESCPYYRELYLAQSNATT